MAIVGLYFIILVDRTYVELRFNLSHNSKYYRINVEVPGLNRIPNYS